VHTVIFLVNMLDFWIMSVDVNLLVEKTNTKTVLGASKEVGLETNSEKLTICPCLVSKTLGRIII